MVHYFHLLNMGYVIIFELLGFVGMLGEISLPAEVCVALKLLMVVNERGFEVFLYFYLCL